MCPSFLKKYPSKPATPPMLHPSSQLPLCQSQRSIIFGHHRHPFLGVIFNQLFIIFRDNGITIQIMTYQVYTELILFLTILIFFLLPIEKNLVVAQIVGILFSFAIFVIHPLFYLNGDVNFRNRVQNQGLWKALKKELFQTN